jgi:[acyl-carrier-protein] S-malonyltransferase
MGQDLFNEFSQAKETFISIDNIAGRSLSKLCFEGPESELKRTINTQPTVLAMSLAAWRCYEALGGPRPDYVAGHSLGEFTALVAAGVISLEDAVRLVEKRARLMEECPRGAMSAILGVAADELEAATAEASGELKCGGASDNEACVIVANFNTREQLVISGNPNAVARVGELAKAKGGKVIPLPVGGAFHSPLMVAAAREFANDIEKASCKDAACYVVQNFDAQATKEAKAIKEKLTRQIDSSVRWCATIENMLGQGVDIFVEIGPGKALAGMVKKIDKSAKIYNVYDAATLRQTVAALKELFVGQTAG